MAKCAGHELFVGGFKVATQFSLFATQMRKFTHGQKSNFETPLLPAHTRDDAGNWGNSGYSMQLAEQ
jgi:hypothetical protein